MSRLGNPSVLILNYEFPPMGGGAGHASYELAKRLVNDGYQVDVLTSGMDDTLLEESVDGINVSRVRSRRKGIHNSGLLGALSYVFAAIPRCRQLLQNRRYDVVHYYFGLPTGMLMLLVPEIRKLPSVVSLRGSDVPGYDQDNLILRCMHFILSPATRYIWRRARKVLANSEELRRLAERVPTGRSIGVIRNGVDLDMFEPCRRAEVAHKAGTAPLRIATVARLIPRKGLEHLLNAVEELRDPCIQLSIYGAGSHAEQLKDLVVALGLQNQVNFAGFKDRAQLPNAYQTADIFVLPSVSESCSMALLEAMASGLPVIATSVGGNVELVANGVNGFLVPPADPAALAGAIRRMASDPARRSEMGVQSRRLASQYYDADVVADRYKNVYKEIIDAHARSGHLVDPARSGSEA